MKNIIIVGSSGHAKVIIDIVRKEGKYNIVGLLDAYREIGEKTLGYSVLGQESDLPELKAQHDVYGALIAIGDNYRRYQIADKLQRVCPDISFVSAIHPSATIGTDVTIEQGSVVMSGVAINPSVTIGRFCILNTNSSIDHDGVMEDFSSLAPGVNVGGNCRIGKYSALSIGAKLVHKISIGEHTVIGAGSVVTKAVESNVVAYGVPAKAIRHREKGDVYL